MIISIDVKKAFHKIRHPFMIKKKNKKKQPLNMYEERKYKLAYRKHHIEGLKAESCSTKIRKTRMATPAKFIQHNIANPKQRN